jgi:hypothetical protein
MAALGITMILLAVTLLKVMTTVTSNTERVQSVQQIAAANRQAIFVSCTLLSNAIAQSGGGALRSSNERPTPRQQLNSLYIAAIIGRMTRGERAQERRLRHQTDGRLIEIPDCLRIARHPESVRAVVP